MLLTYIKKQIIDPKFQGHTPETNQNISKHVLLPYPKTNGSWIFFAQPKNQHMASTFAKQHLETVFCISFLSTTR